MKLLFTLAFISAAFLGNAQLYYSFSASSDSYTPITGGTVAPLSLISTGTGYPAMDEGYSNNIPIGFNFLYDSVTYTVIHANTNGFATFGAPFVTDNTNFDREYYVNNLATSSSFNSDNSSHRPILAPLWDDLGLTSNTGISYQTTGVAPNRIFTLQWEQVEWRNVTNPVLGDISFQIKLYETTNVIEFIYQQESGALSAPSASIGITADSTGANYFLSLINTSAAPGSSATTETTTLSEKPATGQVYRFQTDPCTPPFNLTTSGYSDVSATVKWQVQTFASSYQFTITTSSTPPATGTSTTNTYGTVAALSPATDYYAHVKTNCGTNWRTISFKTATAPVAPPFEDGFETGAYPDLPEKWREENFSDPSYEAKWQTLDDASLAASGTNFLYVGAYVVDADNWAYTPSIALNAGSQYKLRFKFTTYDGVHSLVVKMGRKVGKDSMLVTPLFSKNDIDLNGPYSDTSINFTVPNTGTWYIGFNYNTAVANNPNFGILLLDDVSITPMAVLPVSLLNFSGSVSGNAHALNWQTAGEQNSKGFELQQSSNGVDFEKVSFIESKSFSNNSNEKLSYSYLNHKLLPGKNYYRLKQLDKDGRFVFSAVVMLQHDKTLWNIAAFPNPVNDVVTVVINSPARQKTAMSLYTADGKLVWSKAEMLQQGQQSVIIPMQIMHAGTYYLQVNSTELQRLSLSITKQ